MEINQQPQPEQEDLIAEYHTGMRQLEIEGYENVVKKARNALFWAGGLIFISELIAMYRIYGTFDSTLLIFALIEAGVFIGLAFFTKKKPYTAIVLGLIAFAGVIVLSVVGNGMQDGGAGVLKALFSGILVKILIILALVRPLKEAKELQRIHEEEKKNGL